MMGKEQYKLTLDRAASYQIKVPGALDAIWLDSGSEITITVERNEAGQAVTTLTCEIDQAGLHGLLQWLYSMGLPLISVVCVEHV